MRFFMSCLVLLGLFSLAYAQDPEQQPDVPTHPMDALTGDEISLASKILKEAGLASEKALFAHMGIIEPDKLFVKSWKPEAAFDRKALVIFRDRQKTFEADIDLVTKSVVANREVAGAHPPVMDDEWERAQEAFQKDPRFLAALEKRGLKFGNDIFCTPNSGSHFPDERIGARRILKVPCFTSREKLHPQLSRPIENLMGVVDSETGEVLNVFDGEAVPIETVPKGYGNELPLQDAPILPLDLISPNGSNIKITGNMNVEWLNWSFLVRSDRRAGVVVSLVNFKDRDRPREMIYQMNVSEMFVPYMDPNPTWSYRTFLDVGEYGLGYLMSRLEPGADCPFNSFYGDLTFPGDYGGPYTRPRAICIFERNTGDPAWRHYSTGRKTVAGEPQMELVVRHIPTIGNYDYVIDYIFTPQGNIRVRAGATGFDAIKNVASADMQSPSALEDTSYGSLIAPFSVAPFHDHYINFRIDADVDGPGNAMLRDAFVPQALDGAGRKSIWTLKTQRYATEGPITSDHGQVGGENWRISNPKTFNRLKQNPSLWLNAHHDATSILARDDTPQQRAQFSTAQFWITRFKSNEKWAAGDYPNLSLIDSGLPTYVADAEPIADEDIVLWYTMGFRHMTRPEDFPILPTFWHELTIRPAFFFDMDPSMTFNSGRPLVPEQQQ